MLYDFMKEKEKAEIYLQKEVEAVNDLNSRLELLQFYLNNNLRQKAQHFGEEILKIYPDTEDVKQVLKRLREEDLQR